MWSCHKCLINNYENENKCKACFSQKGFDCFNSECCICLQPQLINNIIVKIPCRHFICINCFCIAYKSNYRHEWKLKKCPYCRDIISSGIGYKIGSNKKLFIVGENNCPHCIVKKYLKN